MMRVLGAVLAGGRSRRFGSNKAEALLGGRPLIDWVAASLAAQVDALVVCGGPAPWLADRPRPDLGPLGGLNAALHHARSADFDAVLSAPCDTPLLPVDLREQLARAGPAAYLDSLPVIGLWPVTLAPALDDFLENGDSRSMRAWIAATGARPCIPDTVPANLNTPADLAAVAHLIGPEAARPWQ